MMKHQEVTYCVLFDQVGARSNVNLSTKVASAVKHFHAADRGNLEKSWIRMKPTVANKQFVTRAVKCLIGFTLLINTLLLLTWHMSNLTSDSKLYFVKRNVLDFFNVAQEAQTSRVLRPKHIPSHFNQPDAVMDDGENLFRTSSDELQDEMLGRTLADYRLYCNGSHNMTVVTAYFNIGAYPKGFFGGKRSPKTYASWLRGFASLVNPVMFFTDDADAKNLFENWRSPKRSGLLCTRTYLINRTDLWPFLSLYNISLALNSKQYFPAPPITSHPVYAAATMSKYVVTEMAVRLNPFRTQHFAWLDAGIYRESLTNEELGSFFVLDPLPSLNRNQVGYLQIFEKEYSTAEQFFLQHHDWIGGGAFFARTSIMLRMTQEFNRFARFYMQRQLIGSDQQVLGAMFGGIDNSEIGIGSPKVELKLYYPNTSISKDPWFFLAYYTRRKVA